MGTEKLVEGLLAHTYATKAMDRELLRVLNEFDAALEKAERMKPGGVLNAAEVGAIESRFPRLNEARNSYETLMGSYDILKNKTKPQ